MAAIVTLGISSRRIRASPSAETTGRTSSRPSCTISLRSAPAAKVCGPPHTTTARMSSRRPDSATESWSSSETWRLMALAGGRSSLMVDIGVLSHAHLEGGAEYHRAEEAGHVHLTCSRCGAEDDLSLEEARALSHLIERHRGFLPDLTHFAISGLCAECRRLAG